MIRVDGFENSSKSGDSLLKERKKSGDSLLKERKPLKPMGYK
jgi:hypothetical protein